MIDFEGAGPADRGVPDPGALVRAGRADRRRGVRPASCSGPAALEHGQIAVLPLIAMCDRWDIGGLSTNVHPQTGGATIFVYDGHPGGIGITPRGVHQFEGLSTMPRG